MMNLIIVLLLIRLYMICLMKLFSLPQRIFLLRVPLFVYMNLSIRFKQLKQYT